MLKQKHISVLKYLLPTDRQTLPHENQTRLRPKDEQFEQALKDGKPIFLLFHGQGGHRAFGDRPLRYQLLSSMGYHVLAIDYRGEFSLVYNFHMNNVVADKAHWFDVMAYPAN